MGLESIAEKVFTSNLGGIWAWCVRKYKIHFMHTVNHFTDYHLRAYKQYGTVNTLALINSQRILTDIYFPQTLVKGGDSDNQECIKIDKYPVELMRKYKRIRIIDAVGMGKSTMMKRMFIDLIESGIENIGIPIYIELNKLNKNHSILNVIREELSPNSKLSPDSDKFDGKLLLELFQRDRFIFFMDGYDEISNAVRTEVTNGIKAFIQNAGAEHHYILTSRPGVSLAAFGDFHEFRIQPLSKEEAFELLSKYDMPKQPEYSKDLKKELETGKYDSIVDCLNNPMLVSLLYFEYINNKRKLKKHHFFNEIYNAIFRDHDYSKVIEPHEKESRLDSYDFNRVLRYVGYFCVSSGMNAFDGRVILNVISSTKKDCSNSEFSVPGCLNDLLLAVPFFYKDEDGYKWVHQPLMEYFAALFLAEDVTKNHEKYLKDVFDNAPFKMCVNIMDIYQEVDPKGFLVFVVKPLCEKFISFYDSKKPYTDKIRIKGGMINTRVGLLFHLECVKLGIIDRNVYNRLRKSPSCRVISLSSSKDAFLITQVNDNHPLLIILYQITPSLYAYPKRYTKYNTTVLRDFFSNYKISGLCDEKSLYDVDERTGDENEEAYLLMNELLIQSVDSDPKIVPLDYQVCKERLESIKKIKVQNKKAIDELVSEI